ncbi:MAG: RHS repeat protein [Polyangiaceae bacterium]|nr:RHS repeat protein [Polyangiaceae bacterium]
MRPQETPEHFQCSAISDPYGNTIHLAYENDRLLLIEDSVGRVIKPRYDANGYIRAFEVKNAAVRGRWVTFRSYSYDADGNLSAAADAEGNLTEYWYRDHLLTEERQPGGLLAHFRYDKFDRCIETWCDHGSGRDPALADDLPTELADRTPIKGMYHCKVEYFEDGQRSVVNSREERRFENGAHGGLLFGTTGSAIHTHERDNHGYVTCYVDPNAERWETSRDVNHRVLETTNPLGQSTRREYRADGQLIRQTSPLGHWLEFEYDQVGGCSVIRDSMGTLLQVSRESRGLPVQYIFPNGGAAHCDYDAHGNRIRVVEPNGDTKHIAFDYLGRAVEFTDARGQVTRYHYDRRGLLARVDAPNGLTTLLEYDAQSRLCRHTDPAQRVHRFEYGGADILCRAIRPDGTTIRYGLDWEGSLVSVERTGGLTWRYQRDSSGLVVSEQSPDGRLTRYRNDACGRVIEELRSSGARTTFEYDPAGRLLSREYSDNTKDEFEYDADGHLVRATSSNGVQCLFKYDPRGRRVEEQVEAPTHSFAVEREFDQGYEPIRVDGPEGNYSIRRDPMGRPQRIELASGWWCESRYDYKGREHERSTPGGLQLQVRFDPRDRVAQQTMQGPSTSMERRWSWDPGDRLLGGFDNGTPFYATHDELGQLVRSEAHGLVEEFRTTPDFELILDGKTTLLSGGRAEQFGDVHYTYDADGQVVSRTRLSTGEQQILEWSDRGQLSKITDGAGNQTRYEYDAFDRRIAESVVDPQNRLVRERHFAWNYFKLTRVATRELTGGTIQEQSRQILYSDQTHEPIATAIDGDWHSLVTDLQRRPMWEFDGHGHGSDHTYDALGNSRSSQPLRLAGQFADDTGLTYNLHRYYDAASGRFISPDPIGPMGGLNAYAFAENRFLTEIDPSGLARPSTTVITTTGGGTSTGHSQGYHTANDSNGNYSGGVGSLPPAFPPLGGTYTGPNQCGEVEALNNMFAGLDPNNPDHREAIRARAQEIQSITPTRDNRDGSAGATIPPCMYCTQRLAHLSDVSGVNLFERVTPPTNGGSPVRNVGPTNAQRIRESGVPSAFPYSVTYPPGGGSAVVTRGDGTTVAFS